MMKKCDCENDFEIAEDWRKNNQDCSMVLDSRVKGKECWPIRKHVLCLKCNRRRQDESFLYFNFIVEKNLRQDESEPEESDAEEWTHHSRGVKQQVWDDIIAFHNYLFNKLDPNPDFGIPKSKSDFLPKNKQKLAKMDKKGMNHLKTMTIIMNCCKSPSIAAIWVSN